MVVSTEWDIQAEHQNDITAAIDEVAVVGEISLVGEIAIAGEVSVDSEDIASEIAVTDKITVNGEIANIKNPHLPVSLADSELLKYDDEDVQLRRGRGALLQTTNGHLAFR